MQPFARGGSGDRRFRRAKPGDDFGMIAPKPPDHEEARDRNAAEHEARIGGERLLESADRIAGKRVIVGDRAIEASADAGEPARVNPCWSLAIDLRSLSGDAPSNSR